MKTTGKLIFTSRKQIEGKGKREREKKEGEKTRKQAAWRRTGKSSSFFLHSARSSSSMHHDRERIGPRGTRKLKMKSERENGTRKLKMKSKREKDLFVFSLACTCARAREGEYRQREVGHSRQDTMETRYTRKT